MNGKDQAAVQIEESKFTMPQRPKDVSVEALQRKIVMHQSSVANTWERAHPCALRLSSIHFESTLTIRGVARKDARAPSATRLLRGLPSITDLLKKIPEIRRRYHAREASTQVTREQLKQIRVDEPLGTLSRVVYYAATVGDDLPPSLWDRILIGLGRPVRRIKRTFEHFFLQLLTEVCKA